MLPNKKILGFLSTKKQNLSPSKEFEGQVTISTQVGA